MIAEENSQAFKDEEIKIIRMMRDTKNEIIGDDELKRDHLEQSLLDYLKGWSTLYQSEAFVYQLLSIYLSFLTSNSLFNPCFRL